jgi:hypothetical protein
MSSAVAETAAAITPRRQLELPPLLFLAALNGRLRVFGASNPHLDRLKPSPTNTVAAKPETVEKID